MLAPCLEFSSTTTSLSDLLPTGALVIDSDLRITDWNRTLVKWSSITKEQAIGEKLTQLFPNLSESRYLERLTQVFSYGLPATYSAALHRHFLPMTVQHGLECEFMIQQTEVQLLSKPGNLALITIQDVTFQYYQLQQLKKERADLVRAQQEMDQLNQQLTERNQELDDFTNIASHDLKEPLRKITTFGKLLEEGLPVDIEEENQQFLFFMMDAATRMSTILQDLLVLSRTGRTEIQQTKIDLKELVAGVISLLDVTILENKAVIEIDSLPQVISDSRLVTQLFQNLIGNALKFSAHKSPQVRITAQLVNEEWVLGVKDNGIGINPKHAKNIFAPFVRLHTRKNYEGTGFGLSICKKAVAKLGGRIWVESAPDEGAHFKFTLPALQAESMTTDGR